MRQILLAIMLCLFPLVSMAAEKVDLRRELTPFALGQLHEMVWDFTKLSTVDDAATAYTAFKAGVYYESTGPSCRAYAQCGDTLVYRGYNTGRYEKMLLDMPAPSRVTRGDRGRAFNSSFSGRGLLYGEYATSEAGTLSSEGCGYGRLVLYGDTVAAYLHSDYQGSVVMVTDSAGRVEQHNTYYPYGEPHRLPSGQRRLYCGKERESVTGEYDYGARQHFAPGLLWTVPDALADRTPDVSPYVFCNANPVRNIDPDGNTPTVLTGVLGAAIGSLAYMTIEFTIQLMSDEKMDWKAVGGAGARGAIVGSVTGLTLGSGTATAVAATASANVVGGIADRAIQGEETTATDVAVDAAVGAGSAALGSAAGNATKKALDKASPAVKGKIGEAVTYFKYSAKGYRKVGKKYEVFTGGRTPTGRKAKAKYDFLFEHRITGKRIARESKFNGSELTPNQRAAWGNSKYPIEIDRTTSDDIGRWVQSTTMFAPALTPAK